MKPYLHTLIHRPFEYLRIGLALCLLALISTHIHAAPLVPAAQKIILAKGVEVPLTVFPSSSKKILLWLPSEDGLVTAEFNTATKLAKSGLEVWLADMHAAYFLPIVPSSMQQIPTKDVAQLIRAVQQRSGKSVYVITAGKGASLALTAAAIKGGNLRGLRGAILLSPTLYVETPEPGAEAQFIPAISKNRLPVVILQPELSPLRWRIDQLQSRLAQRGATVKVKLLPAVRDRFYYRDDALPQELALTPTLPHLILNAYHQLEGAQP